MILISFTFNKLIYLFKKNYILNYFLFFTFIYNNIKFLYLIKFLY